MSTWTESDVGIGVEDVADALQNLGARVSELEGVVSSPDVMTGPDTNEFPTGIVLDGVTVRGTTSSSPTAINVVASTYYDDIIADISWTPGAGGASEYQAEIAWKTGGVYEVSQQLRTGGTQVRVVGLRPNSTYGVRVYPINQVGVVGTPYPASDWQDFTTTQDATIPALVTGLTVTAGLRSLVAVWADSDDVDVKNGQGQYQVLVATDSGFTSIVKDKYVGGSITSVTDLSPNTQYWVKVRAIDSTGNQGPYTSGASATTARTGTSDYSPLSVDAAAIADLAVGTAKIANLAVTDAKITSVTVDKVSAGTITSKDYVLGAGGQIKTASLSPGILLNNQGLSLYDGTGTRVIYLDATTGAGTFKGAINSGSTITGTTITASTIQTGTTGKRLYVSPTPVFLLYTGDVDEYLPGQVSWGTEGATGAARQPWINIFAPDIITGGNPALRPVIAMNGPSRDGLKSGDITLSAATLKTLGQSLMVLGTTGVTYDKAQVIVKNDVNYGGPNGPTVLIALWEAINGIAPMIRVHGASGNEIHFINSASSAYIPIRASAFTVSSSLTSKVKVKSLGNSLERLLELRPVNFKRPRKPELGEKTLRPATFNDDKEYAGLIAEEIAEVFPEAVYFNHEGDPDGIEVSSLLACTIKAIQELAGLVPELTK